MSGPPSSWLAVAVVAATGLALVRLILWWRAAKPETRGPAWRFPVLVGLNLAAAGLLYLTLAPPDVGLRSGRLVVLTAGATTEPVLAPGDIAVALPEGPAEGAAERVPDLATALRRHPEIRSVEVLGAGLTARDRQPLDRPLAFIAPPVSPRGLTRISLPRPVAPGGPFNVAGTVGALGTGTVELVDPGGAVVDRAPVATGGTFALAGAARAAGLALFDLRVKDAAGRMIERIEVPVEAREQPAPRVRVLAGAPGPETRFLRRWAEAAGIDLSVQLSLGAGVDLTAAPAPLTDQGLAETDLLVIDERRWELLSGAERAAVRAAVGGGMGLLLRPTGPLSDATRREWGELGAVVRGGENTRPLVLDDRTGTEGASTSSAVGDADESAPAPELTRRDFTHSGADTVSLLTDADGVALASWRLYGAGRVGVWVVADSYALVLSGRSSRYGELWSRMFSTLGRPANVGAATLRGLARAGERATLCGVTEGSVLVVPDGRRSLLIIDPRTGSAQCAAFWPTRPGWHTVSVAPDRESPVYVHPADATPSLIANEQGEATLDLAATSGRSGTGAAAARQSPGAPWPWFAGLLAALTGLWWLERHRPAVAVVRSA